MNYFPTYLALGNAFCNRKEELKRIVYDLKGNSPILLMSPRRYGKTSLALKAFEQIKWPYSHIDLYKALSEEDIERFILNGIGQLLGKLEGAPKKLLHLASNFFASMQIKVVLEKAGIQLEFNQNRSAPTDMILKSLEKLHDLAKKEKHVILFLDEFQIVGEVTDNHAIEAAIREASQKSTHIAYVFSGSNRHLMEQMFYDRKRPFYKLCDQIKLDRINAEAYEKHIQMAAQKTWNTILTQKTLEIIFELTELHSYYVNKLCSLLWQINNPPTEKEVLSVWQQFVLENKSSVERELDLLSINQRKLLIFLATHKKSNELFSKKITQTINLTSSSVQRAIEPLIEKDYVFIDHEKFYRILDPLIKSVLES